MASGDEERDTPPRFAKQLEAAIKEKLNGNVSALARRLAGDGARDNQIRNRRREIHKWLAGGGITETNLRRLESALEVERGYFGEPKKRQRQDTAALHRKLDEIMALLQELYELTAQPPARLAANPEWLRRRLRALEEKVDEQRKSTAEGLQEVRRTVDVLRASLQERQPPASEEPPQVEGQQ